MSQSTLTKKSAPAEKEVFARTPHQIGNESCDKCGTLTSPARYVASKGEAKLFFCAHHTRRYAAELTQSGFVIDPPNFTFDAALTK